MPADAGRAPAHRAHQRPRRPPRPRAGPVARVPRPRGRLAGPVEALRPDARKPLGIDHGLSYDAMASGKIAVTDIYTTDAQIAAAPPARARRRQGLLPALRRRAAVPPRRRRAPPGAMAGAARRWPAASRRGDDRDERPRRAAPRALRRHRQGRSSAAISTSARRRDATRRRRPRDALGHRFVTRLFAADLRAPAGPAPAAGGRRRVAAPRCWACRSGAAAAAYPRSEGPVMADGGRAADDPVAGAARDADPAAGPHRHGAGAGRADALRAAADRAQHGHRPAGRAGRACARPAPRWA